MLSPLLAPGDLTHLISTDAHKKICRANVKENAELSLTLHHIIRRFLLTSSVMATKGRAAVQHTSHS